MSVMKIYTLTRTDPTTDKQRKKKKLVKGNEDFKDVIKAALEQEYQSHEKKRRQCGEFKIIICGKLIF
jgi:hypothetical protein